MRNTYEKRRSDYNFLIRPNGKPLNDQDKLILDLLIQFTKNVKIGTTTYEYLLNNKFPNKISKKTVNRTLKNISLYIYAKFKKKVIIDEIIHRDKIAFCRVIDFEQKMSISASKPCNKKYEEKWTGKNIELDKPQNKKCTKTELDTSYKAEEQAVLKKWTQENAELDKKRVEVNKNVQFHIEEGNIPTPLKGVGIITEEKEKSKKKKKNNQDKMSTLEISEFKNSKTESLEKPFFAENFEGSVKTSYAFGGDEVLPLSKTIITECVFGNLVVARKRVIVEMSECKVKRLAWLAKGENDNARYLPDTDGGSEAQQLVSEDEHYQIASAIPLPEIEESDVDSSAAKIIEAEVTLLPNIPDPEDEMLELAKQTLSSEDEEDAKWQMISKLVLQRFKSNQEMAYGILHNLTITAIRPNRIGLSFARDLGFSEADKKILRSCLRDVYGPTIEMVISRPEESKPVSCLKVHMIAEDDKRLPEGLKHQFKLLDKNETTEVVEDNCRQQDDSDIVHQAVDALTPEIVIEHYDNSENISSPIDYPIAQAKHKWGQISRDIVSGVYASYTEQIENYLSNIEVLGMTGKVLRLEGWWLACDKLKDYQDLVERVAGKYDLALEIKNKQDGDIMYMPWEYFKPKKELQFDITAILKKVN